MRIGPSTCAVAAFAALALAGTPRAAERGFVPPPGADFVNVKRDCSAKGDGVADDTAALRAAFGAGKASPHPRLGAARAIFLPNGVYLVSGRLDVGDKKKFIVGQSREGVVIRLKDGADGFQDPARPLPVVNFGEGSYEGWHFANNFNQRIANLTIDVGRGNPGATGLLYHTNNLGGVYHVTIRSSDPARRGARGLHLGSNPGPGLVWDVAVEGFDTGCLVDGNLHSMTLGRLALSNQRDCGLRVDGNFAAVWGLRSRNRVPVLIMSKGHLALLDAECSGGTPGGPAIRILGGTVFCRNIRTSGYGKSLVSEGSGGAPAVEIAAPAIDEFVRPRGFSLFEGGSGSLRLPVEEPPVSLDWGDPSGWAVIGPGEDSRGRIQKAIDDGAETVFLVGAHEIAGTIHLRNRLRRVTAGGASFRSRGFKGPLWRLEDGAPPEVFIEFLCDEYGEAAWHVEHASRRTLVCRSAGVLAYRNTVTGGKAFFLDSGPGPGSVVTGPQEVRAWQVNTESYEHNPHILNDGGMLFVCGLKVEKDRTAVGTQGGGWTEVLGGLLYKNRQRIGMAPAFFNRDSNMCVSIGHYGERYDSLVEETRLGETRNLAPASLGGHWVPLYTGWQRRFQGSR